MTEVGIVEEGTDEVKTDHPARHAGAPVTWSFGQECLHPSRSEYVAVISALKAEGYIQVSDL